MKKIILGFLIFFVYPASMMFLILMHRKYISEVPMFSSHTSEELFKRASIYYFYLLAIHTPLFLVWEKVISKIESLDFINTFYFGVAFSLCVLFSFVFVFKFFIFAFRNFSYFTWKKLIFIITVLLGICVGLIYIFFAFIISFMFLMIMIF